ncbi:hypothetical protein RI129_003960 [Pyrocoelia pectoralis]|uniref:Regulation of nuclear pre-mRNA domain-containing protein 2 n=1 Tax=Pyrocoelia pectoralis TaxID=417401 RepID=A0AAN7VRV3_9COLE
MDTKPALAEVNAEIEFNTIAFEKKLSALKDSQDSINNCCQWCLQNRQHHKKIVSAWLNVLKRVKIEHRLTLFYLANDVIQYSKRRNYDFVESWGTTLQKATTMVRDEKIKNKVLRIFKIWEERGIYGEEFIADLCGLISASPSGRKTDDPHQFNPSYLIQKVWACSKLETDTDTKLNQLKEHNPKIQIDSDLLISSLKDRANVDDVEKELEEYNKHMENYINALKLEIKARIHLISLLTQAESQLDKDKKDVKFVTTAYRTFAARVKTLKKKLDEKIPSLASPVPSPDVNAPSPSSESEIDLPAVTSAPSVTTTVTTTAISTEVIFANPGYYNPVPPPSLDLETTFKPNNNFSSFIGTNMPFNLMNTSSSLFGNNSYNSTTTQAETTTSYSINNAISSLFPSIACPPPPPSSAPDVTTPNYSYNAPLLPPPMPPFSKTEDQYGMTTYAETYTNSNSTFRDVGYDTTSTTTTYPPTPLNIPPPPIPTTPFSTEYSSYQNSESSVTNYTSNSLTTMSSNMCVPMDDYNPAEELETWDPEPSWDQPPPILQDTPESPPMSEKTGFGDPVEYHEETVFAGGGDVDHRMLPPPVVDPVVSNDPKLVHHNKDIDHRNLISLTGSPSEVRSSWTAKTDQDFRVTAIQSKIGMDQDYRVPFIENLKLPPPPPPPKSLTSEASEPQYNSGFHQNKNTFNMDRNNFDINVVTNSNFSKPPPNTYNSMDSLPKLHESQANKLKFVGGKKPGLSPRKCQDNVESIDMDLSDDNENGDQKYPNSPNFEDCFDQPPSDLFDDVDANNFLDNVHENLDLEDLVSDDFNTDLNSNNSDSGILSSQDFHLKDFPSMFHHPPPHFNKAPPLIGNMLDRPMDWNDQNFNKEIPGMIFINDEMMGNRIDFRNTRMGRGKMRGNFNNGGVRGNRGGMPPRGGRGNPNYRGYIQRGIPRGRGFRGRGNDGMRGRGYDGNRGRGHDGNRGRGDFRGRNDYRNVRGGFNLI